MAALASAADPPEAWLGALCFSLSIVALEWYGFELKSGVRFNPAVPVYLAAAACPGVGAAVPALVAAGATIARARSGILENLAGCRDLSLALAAAGLVHFFLPEKTWAVAVVGPLLYAALRTLAKPAFSPSKDAKDKRSWYLFHLRVKPLEIGQVFAAPLLVTAYQYSPLTVLLSVPVLATGKLAAESILQKTQEEAVQDMARRLQGAEEREQQVEKRLQRAQGDKLALDAFSKLLLQKPDLQTTAKGLLQAAEQVVDFDSGAVFLGDPPEPYIYRASPDTEANLQGSSLTGLREQVVDRAWNDKRPVHQRRAPEDADRLFVDDQVAAALPLAGIGVLYFGRWLEEPFSKEELEQLSWLADKVKQALRSAYAQQEEHRRRRSLARTLQSLEHRVAWMALLIEGAETLASTLERPQLVNRLSEFVKQAIPHEGGSIFWTGGEVTAWGAPIQTQPELLDRIAAWQGTLRLEQLAQTPYRHLSPGACSLLGCALKSGEEVRAVMVLVAQQESAFTQPMGDLLWLLNSQAAMALANADLYQEVVEARKHLEESQAQLVQSSKLTALGQLAAGVAHELNTPLGAISLAIEESLRQIQAAGTGPTRLLDMASQAVQQSREIIDRLMAYVRTPSGEFTSFDLSEALRQASEFLSGRMQAEEVSLELNTENAMPVRGEYQPLVQVFLNLLSNAADAVKERPPEERRITVKTMTSDDEVTVTVSDSGCGIKPEHLDRIFDPFFTTKPVGKGTGLGLWATHRIVTEHGGRLQVNSDPGQGTTFSVSLPKEKRAE